MGQLPADAVSDAQYVRETVNKPGPHRLISTGDPSPALPVYSLQLTSLTGPYGRAPPALSLTIAFGRVGRCP